MRKKDKSGIIPTGGHILVLPDKIKEKTDSGIYYPEQTRDREQLAVTKGTIVAIGKTAWKDLDDGTPWAELGDRITYPRNAGFFIKGKDDVDYVIINDNDIIAKLLF